MRRRIANGCRSHPFRTATRRAALLLSAVAAAGLACPQARANSVSGFSLGGGVGDYDLRITNAAALGTALDTYSTNDTAWQAFVKYRFVPFLALQGQYMDLGTGRAFAGPNEITTTTQGWAPWLVATLPLGSTHAQVVGPFELFIKGGEYFYQFHDDFITPVGVYRYYSNNYDHFVYGGGLGLVFVRNLDVRLEYDVLHLQETNRSNALWLTAAFNF